MALLFLNRDNFAREYNDIVLLKKILEFILPFKKSFFLAIAALVAQSIITLIVPLVFTQGLEIYKNGNITTVVFWALVYLFLNVLIFVSFFFMRYGQATFVPNFMENLRLSIFETFQKQDIKFFDNKRSGNLANRVLGDASNTLLIPGVLLTVIGNSILIIVSIAILYFISAFLTFFIVISAILIILFSLTFRRLARNNSRKVRKTESNITASIAEAVEGIQISKSYGQEDKVKADFDKLNKANYSAGLNLNLVLMTVLPTIDLFSALTTWLILQYGGTMALQQSTGLSGYTLYLFVMYLTTFFVPLIAISNFYSQFQTGLGGFERIVTVLDSKSEVKWNEEGIKLENVQGDIKFENIFFSYSPDKPVLENFNLHIKPGERLAIVGHTGAGKTTITNLIARFYEYQAGTIYIDGYDIRSLNLKSYLTHVGLVQQDTFLFAGSVRDNIRYGKFDATDEEVATAIHTVQAEEFIENMPEGLDTDVKERGSRLSTGQRQLVCFARAVLSNPEILILDEATSSVDAYTESVIQDALEKLMEKRTSIVIAHRLSTVVNADRILVMENGKIIEEGTHAELMKLGRKYRDLYDIYFKHQVIDVEYQPQIS